MTSLNGRSNLRRAHRLVIASVLQLMFHLVQRMCPMMEANKLGTDVASGQFRPRRSGMAYHSDTGLVGPAERDLRLDLMRGIGQWMVF